MTTNPYETPNADFRGFRDQEPGPLPGQQDPGLVHQVRIVAVLMMVQGGLELLMGIFMVSIGFVISFLMPEAMEPATPQPEGSDQFIRWFPLVIYGLIGVVHLAIGALHAYAGWRNYKFKSRTLGITAVVAGVGTMLGCYCLPTAGVLMVYGLIVMLNGPVQAAFVMGENGYSGEAILSTFSRYGGAPPGGPVPR